MCSLKNANRKKKKGIDCMSLTETEAGVGGRGGVRWCCCLISCWRLESLGRYRKSGSVVQLWIILRLVFTLK